MKLRRYFFIGFLGGFDMLKSRWTKLLMATVIVGTAGCSRFCSRKETAPKPTDTANQPAAKTPNYSGITVTQVVKREQIIGKGAPAKPGSHVTVKYTEYVYDPAALGNMGPIIYTTKDSAVDFKIGDGKVIKGFEEGLDGMMKGGKRQLIIPAAAAYGDAGRAPNIPPKAMVMIDVEMLDAK